MTGATLIATAIYILLQVVFIGALRPADLTTAWPASATAVGTTIRWPAPPGGPAAVQRCFSA